MRYIAMLLGVVCGLGRAEPILAATSPNGEGVEQVQPLQLQNATSVFMNKLESSLIGGLSDQGIEGDLHIELIGDQDEILRSLYYGDADIQKVQVTNVNTNSGYFNALAEIQPRPLGRAVTVQLQGQYKDVVYIPVARDKILKGDIITQQDIMMMQRDSRLIKGDVINRPEDMVGKMAKRNIMPGKPISARVVAEPVLIKKGSHVTMVYSTPAIRLRTVGVALEDGERGALIPIKNTSSGVVVHAEVNGKNEAVVPTLGQEGEQGDGYTDDAGQNYY